MKIPYARPVLIVVMLLLTACSARQKTFVLNFEGNPPEVKWALEELNPELPADWSSYEYLTFDLKSSTTQRFDIILHDREGIRKLRINPFQGALIRISVPLIHFQLRNTKGHDMAAIGKTPRKACWIQFTGPFGSIKQVDSLGIIMEHPIGRQTIELSRIKLTMQAEDSVLHPLPLVDAFGQWIPDNWPGKAASPEDLMTAWEEEETALRSGDFRVSKYGGFLDARTRATGYFRTEKVDNRWWFVDPEGYLFFSAGVTCITPGWGLARVKGREYIFDTLPPASLNTGKTPGDKGNVPSFYLWNLTRRFGDDWYDQWADFTIRRMDNWGLNTIANWSDTALAAMHRKPYVANISGWGINEGPMGLPDIYGEDYRALVDAAASRQCLPLKDDPYLLGYFIGNEQPWPTREQELAAVILGGADSPMKTAMKKYLEAGDTPDRREDFIYETFKSFLAIVHDAIKKYDPNHLNLGIRYGGEAPDKIIDLSKDYFDVFSLNVYNYSVPPELLQRIYDLSGLPVLIGEFHFGTAGRGLSPWLAQVGNLEERGVGYRYYVENAAAHPALIGTHWFQWIDQPNTGRGDGESGLIGFVDVTDRPYNDLVEASKATFRRLLDVHSGTVPPFSKPAKVQ